MQFYPKPSNRQLATCRRCHLALARLAVRWRFTAGDHHTCALLKGEGYGAGVGGFSVGSAMAASTASALCKSHAGEPITEHSATASPRRPDRRRRDPRQRGRRPRLLTAGPPSSSSPANQSATPAAVALGNVGDPVLDSDWIGVTLVSVVAPGQTGARLWPPSSIANPSAHRRPTDALSLLDGRRPL
jgi:hypothetical protein